MTKVFIDGSAGTTGLRINERLIDRKDIDLIILSDENRKDPQYRKQAIFDADIAFLCLPDSAAIDAVRLAEGSDTVIIDTSTAHRTNENWVYGFPEINGLKSKIASSKRIANPGCHASGFISLIEPLVKNGIMPDDCLLSAFSITGYSGGGKKMISEYEDVLNVEILSAPRLYGLSQFHKHLPEMKTYTGLKHSPLFSPVVSSFYSGMEVIINLFSSQINGRTEDIKSVYKDYYNGKIVKYCENADENGFLSSSKFSGRDDMEIAVFGNNDRITLVSRYDNLGKGASGAAIQNMNLVLGEDETMGLNIGG